MDLRIFTEPQQGASYDDLLAVAQAAERLGFSAFFRSDHYLAMGSSDGLPGPTDAWITLAGIASETSTIRLGTLMTAATFRLPGPLAIAVAQVDAMSGGRVELGIGAAWYDAEHTAYGIPFPPLGERFERLEEQLAVVTGLWGTPDGATFSFPGTHFTLVDSPALPKPVQRPGPPVIIGGSGPVRTPGWLPSTRPSSTWASSRPRTRPTSTTWSATPAAPLTATRAPWCSPPPRRCAAGRRSPTSPAGRPPSDAGWTSSRSTDCAARPRRWSTSSAGSPRSAYHGPTSRSSTWSTSTTLALLAEEVLPRVAGL